MTRRLQLPEAIQNKMIPTLNQMGYMTLNLDPYSQEFIRFASSAPSPVLDIGCAYGVASLAALEAGATVVANDIEADHLTLLRQKTTNETRKRLVLCQGDFSSREINFLENSFSAVLICRVLHFFAREKIKKTFKKIYNYLDFNGKLFIVSDTPYVSLYKNMIQDYETRIRNMEEWPGEFCGNIPQYISGWDVNHPIKTLHFLDQKVLKRELEFLGFQVEKVELFPRPDYLPEGQLDGRECIGLIARKIEL